MLSRKGSGLRESTQFEAPPLSPRAAVVGTHPNRYVVANERRKGDQQQERYADDRFTRTACWKADLNVARQINRTISTVEVARVYSGNGMATILNFLRCRHHPKFRLPKRATNPIINQLWNKNVDDPENVVWRLSPGLPAVSSVPTRIFRSCVGRIITEYDRWLYQRSQRGPLGSVHHACMRGPTTREIHERTQNVSAIYIFIKECNVSCSHVSCSCSGHLLPGLF